MHVITGLNKEKYMCPAAELTVVLIIGHVGTQWELWLGTCL